MIAGRSWPAWLLAAALAGCGRREAQSNPPGLRDSAGKPIVAEPAPAPQAAPRPAPSQPSAPVFDDLGSAPLPGLEPPVAAPAVAPEAAGSDPSTEDAARPRDLGAELSALLDPHGACLDLPAIARSSGRITLSAQVMLLPGGGIMRATVSAPGQPSEARACLEQRLLAAQLPGPIPNAPRSVSATLTIEVAGTPGKPNAYPGPERATAPDLPRTPDLARPDQADLARPDPGDVAGAP